MTPLVNERITIMVLTLDSWSPSYDRLTEDRPASFDTSCECWECLAKTQEEREREAEWDWMCGGRITCNLQTFAPFDPNGKSRGRPRPPEDRTWPEPLYQARVSFWGADDTGMEKFFVYEEDARWFVCHLPPFITKEWLGTQGFIYC